jgi:hypothetical protein
MQGKFDKEVKNVDYKQKYIIYKETGIERLDRLDELMFSLFRSFK